MSAAVPMVKSEGVHKSFGRLEVLRGIDMEVAPKEVVVIIGPSGSGKSTFLRCINHLEKINAGRLSVDGELVGYRQRGDKIHELHDKDVARKRAEIGMVFQRFNLFPHMTAIENVMVGPVQVKTSGSGPSACWTGSGSATDATRTRPSSPADNSSAWPSLGRSACSRSSCSSTNRHQRSTPSSWGRSWT